LSLLLDSNVLLWWFSNHPRLPPHIVERLKIEPELLLSVVTPWELWIKARAERLSLPPDLETGFSGDGFTLLHPTIEDARLAASLPMIHRDPFDRMIIAQALNTRSTVITGDGRFAAYGVDVIRV
jgi:PIN domain nuclease of toxin-antitoxin system